MVYLILGTNEYRVRQEIAALTKRLGVRAETIDADRLSLNSLADIVRGVEFIPGDAACCTAAIIGA